MALCFLITQSANASVVAVDEELIFLSDGRVLFSDVKTNKSFAPQTQSEARNSRKPIFKPTVLPGLADAYKIYETMRTDFQEEAQCTNMAHVWAYEEHQRSGLNSQKLFLFFTKKYIRRYRFGWWFHVSPMVQVKQGEKETSIVLDRRYTTMPLEIKAWTDHFIESGRGCKQVKRFSTYWNNQRSQDCYLIPVSMYHWQPRDIQRANRTGKQKRKFQKAQVTYSYKEAF